MQIVYDRKGEDYYLRLADEAQLAKWHSTLLDPASAPIYVDTDIEEETKQAMLRSIAIIRGETEKIDLSLNKYTADLMVPSLAAVAGAPVFATPSSTKYDAFKHRSFIYDDEEAQQIDASAAMTPESHLVGRARRDTADSLDMGFAQSTNLTDGPDATAQEDGPDDAQDGEADGCEGEGEDGSSSGGSESEGNDGGEEDDAEEEAVDSYDPESPDNQQYEAGDGPEPGAAGQDAVGDAAPIIAHTSSPGKVALYKLSGQNKVHERKGPHHHRPLPHTSSGNTLDKQGVGTGELSAYKFGSQYKKGGDSWIKKDAEGSAGGGAGAATGKGSKGPKQIIPVADNKQPLARRHSSMINQCKF